ncbi:MAG: hypothetical protein KKB13_06245 [Chloroflexi bacterium]|nr:hypothetical protein [Chloroflexota bacterium]
MIKTVVIPKPELTPHEATILRRYLTESHLFSGSEWRALRRVVDKLAVCEVRFGARRYRFAQFYRAFINGSYAWPFLAELSELPDVEQDGLKLQARGARQIGEWLRLNGVQPGQIPHAEYLVAFCLYQWGAFARGHIFEVAIVRDMQQAGIEMTPHDPTRERFALYDLHLPDWGYGDVKTSGYFLDDLTADAPAADFYITRLYVPASRGYRRAVFVTPHTWDRLWGPGQRPPEVLVTSLAAIADRDRVVRVRIEHLTWIVVEYETWKDLVLQRQREE